MSVLMKTSGGPGSLEHILKELMGGLRLTA